MQGDAGQGRVVLCTHPSFHVGLAVQQGLVHHGGLGEQLLRQVARLGGLHGQDTMGGLVDGWLDWVACTSRQA